MAEARLCTIWGLYSAACLYSHCCGSCIWLLRPDGHDVLHVPLHWEAGVAGPVALLDLDPQASLSAWWDERQSVTPALAAGTAEGLGAQIAALDAAGFKMVIIDTPPAVTDTIARTLGHADLVVIPTRPSPHDLRAVGWSIGVPIRFCDFDELTYSRIKASVQHTFAKVIDCVAFVASPGAHTLLRIPTL